MTGVGLSVSLSWRLQTQEHGEGKTPRSCTKVTSVTWSYRGQVRQAEGRVCVRERVRGYVCESVCEGRVCPRLHLIVCAGACACMCLRVSACVCSSSGASGGGRDTQADPAPPTPDT